MLDFDPLRKTEADGAAEEVGIVGQRWLRIPMLTMTFGVGLSACVPSPATVAASNYETIIAASMGHVAGSRPSQAISIGEPWQAVTGELMVCVQVNLPDGRGSFHEASDYSMYALRNGQITFVSRNEVSNCANRGDYRPLKPIPR